MPWIFSKRQDYLGVNLLHHPWDTDSPMMADANRYRRLLGKLIYLIVTHPNITYVVSVLSQIMHEPRMVHWEGALRVLAYIKRAPGKGLIY